MIYEFPFLRFKIPPCLLIPVVAMTALLTMSGICVSQGAQPAPLTLAQAIKISLEGHPQVIAARHRVSALSALEISAGAEKNPQLQVVPLGTLNDNQFILTQTVQEPGKRKVQALAAHSEVIAARARLKELELDVTSDVTKSYIGLYESQRARDLMEESVVLARTLHRLAYSRFELGDVPLIHVSRTEIEVNRLLQELARAKNEVAVSAARLNGAMGREASIPIVLQGLPEFDDREIEPGALKKYAMSHRPEILAAQRAVQIRQYNVELAQKEWVPDIILQARTGDRMGGVEGTQVGVGISMPVWDWGSIRGKAQSAKAQVTEQEALLAKTMNDVGIQVEVACNNLRTSRSIADTYANDLVPRSERMVKTLQWSYEQGGTTLLEIIDAQHMLASVRLEHIRAVSSYFKSLADLVRAVGGDGFVQDPSTRTQSEGGRKP